MYGNNILYVKRANFLELVSVKMSDEKVLFFRLEVKFINLMEAGSDQ